MIKSKHIRAVALLGAIDTLLEEGYVARPDTVRVNRWQRDMQPILKSLGVKAHVKPDCAVLRLELGVGR